MNDKTPDRQADAGIGHIEGGKRVRQRHMEVEQKKVDDVAVEKAIG